VLLLNVLPLEAIFKGDIYRGTHMELKYNVAENV